MWAFVMKFVTSRVGLAAALCALLWGWHAHDKQQALRAAREGYVRAFELEAAQTELRGLRARMAATAEANRVLSEKAQAAEGVALRFEKELEAYQNDTTINRDGVVDDGLLERLRSD
jgi:hypothetical protein